MIPSLPNDGSKVENACGGIVNVRRMRILLLAMELPSSLVNISTYISKFWHLLTKFVIFWCPIFYSELWKKKDDHEIPQTPNSGMQRQGKISSGWSIYVSCHVLICTMSSISLMQNTFLDCPIFFWWFGLKTRRQGKSWNTKQ